MERLRRRRGAALDADTSPAGGGRVGKQEGKVKWQRQYRGAKGAAAQGRRLDGSGHLDMMALDVATLTG